MPSSRSSYSTRYRTRAQQSENKIRRTIRPAVRNQIAASQRYCCQKCSHVFGATFHIDHIRALCLGGDDVLQNLCALCPNCHAEKTSQDVKSYWDNRTSVPILPKNCSKNFASDETKQFENSTSKLKVMRKKLKTDIDELRKLPKVSPTAENFFGILDKIERFSLLTKIEFINYAIGVSTGIAKKITARKIPRRSSRLLLK